MQVSREYALAELKAVRDAIESWIREMENPAAIGPGGNEIPFYPDGVPPGLSVADVEGVPEVQLRAELMAIAGKLEALASY